MSNPCRTLALVYYEGRQAEGRGRGVGVGVVQCGENGSEEKDLSSIFALFLEEQRTKNKLRKLSSKKYIPLSSWFLHFFKTLSKIIPAMTETSAQIV
jgi:hypothetical protein